VAKDSFGKAKTANCQKVINEIKLIKIEIMPTTIAEYYSDELVDWNDSIQHYNEELDGLERKLEEVIRRNSIIGIAEKVEAHQFLINQVSDKFYALLLECKKQEDAIKKDNTFLDDSLIDRKIENQQAELRQQMQAAEKEVIDVKYDCYNFLSGIIKK
jgi:hypothetical protein